MKNRTAQSSDRAPLWLSMLGTCVLCSIGCNRVPALVDVSEGLDGGSDVSVVIDSMRDASRENDVAVRDVTRPAFTDDGGVLDGGLRVTASRAGLHVGSAVSADVLANEPMYASVLAREFNEVTAENEMKWEVIHPAADQWNFAPADAIVDFAQRNGMRVRGHTLVWWRQLPPWVTSLSSADAVRAAMLDHIRGVVEHFRGRVYAWDVVNEALDDQGGYRRGFFQGWLGAPHIVEAYRAAAEADPNALLFYNDYGIEEPGDKTDGLVHLIDTVRASSVRIDGVGLQMHINAGYRPPLTVRVAENLDRLGALGLLVNISEMDVRITPLMVDLTTALATQGTIFHEIVSLCVARNHCTSTTFWGFTDRHTWIETAFGPDHPLLLDENYQPKPAYDGVMRALGGL